MRAFALTCLLLLTACATQPQTVVRVSEATTPDAAGLVDIAARVPDIALDMRYATANNFTGARVDGYDAPKCFLLAPAADALAKVERTLRERHMRLRLFDCYRPVRAVQRFVQWAHAPEDGRTKAAYYPTFDKPALLEEYARTGFAYQRYFESNAVEDYGMALTSPEWLMRTLQRYPDVIMRAYLEEAWGMQDVVILYKKAGHFEPLLGVPEMNAAEPVAKPPGFLAKLLGR